MASQGSKPVRHEATTPPRPDGHEHQWAHDDVEPSYPPVSVSTCSCGAIRRAWQGDDGESQEEITYLS